MKTIVLDTGPLGMASNPKSSRENRTCKQWLDDQVRRGARVVVPETDIVVVTVNVGHLARMIPAQHCFAPGWR